MKMVRLGSDGTPIPMKITSTCLSFLIALSISSLVAAEPASAKILTAEQRFQDHLGPFDPTGQVVNPAATGELGALEATFQSTEGRLLDQVEHRGLVCDAGHNRSVARFSTTVLTTRLIH